MPTTRASSRKVTTPHGRRRRINALASDPENDAILENGNDHDGDNDSDEESLIQMQLRVFMGNVRKLEQDLKGLQKKNQQLQRELDVFREGAPITPRRRAAATTNVDTASKINNLESRIKELEKTNNHLHKKFKRLRTSELRAEANELRETMEEDRLAEQDGVHKMRKLLRKFYDWMTITTLAEDEDCPICFERLKPKKSYGLPCQHLVCAECLPQISRGSDETVKCPQCRHDYPREDAELLSFTETQRFDELLKLAVQWGLIDNSGGDSSEEEAEEEFIEDDDARMEPSDQDEDGAQNSEGEGVKEENDESGVPTVSRSTPESDHMPSYTESPTSEKRRRLEGLAQLRNRRRRIF